MFWPSPSSLLARELYFFILSKNRDIKISQKKNLWEFIFRGAWKEN